MPRSQVIDVATQSLANPYGLSTLPPELYETLWWYSGSNGNTGGTSATSAGLNFIQKGATAFSSSTTSSTVKLYTHNFPSSTQCALEVSLGLSTSITGYASIWDFSSGAIVSGAQVSTTATAQTVIRSGKFTLSQGHVYGVTIWVSGAGYVQPTDASLIIFPNQQLLAQGSLSNITLGTVGQKLTEGQIPLWVYSSGVTSVAGATAYSGNVFLAKGSTNMGQTSQSPCKLHTLSSGWSTSQKFAFEASIYASGSATTYATLWDITSGTQVSGSEVSTTATTATLLRSGQFTLTPGHVYGVGVKGSSASFTYSLTKAHLVPLFT